MLSEKPESTIFSVPTAGNGRVRAFTLVCWKWADVERRLTDHPSALQTPSIAEERISMYEAGTSMTPRFMADRPTSYSVAKSLLLSDGQATSRFATITVLRSSYCVSHCLYELSSPDRTLLFSV